MAVFVRPAVWNYDLGLFRAATGDEDRLEAMLAAIALKNQGLWVAESNQRPVAFAWTEIAGPNVRLLDLYIPPGEAAGELLDLLLKRLDEEFAGVCLRLEVSDDTIRGVGSGELLPAGFRREGNLWTRMIERPT